MIINSYTNIIYYITQEKNMPINKAQLEALSSKLQDMESLVQHARDIITRDIITGFIANNKDETKIEGFVLNELDLNELDVFIDMIGSAWSTIDFIRLPPEAHRNDDPFIAE